MHHHWGLPGQQRVWNQNTLGTLSLNNFMASENSFIHLCRGPLFKVCLTLFCCCLVFSYQVSGVLMAFPIHA